MAEIEQAFDEFLAAEPKHWLAGRFGEHIESVLNEERSAELPADVREMPRLESNFFHDAVGTDAATLWYLPEFTLIDDQLGEDPEFAFDAEQPGSVAEDGALQHRRPEGVDRCRAPCASLLRRGGVHPAAGAGPGPGGHADHSPHGKRRSGHRCSGGRHHEARRRERVRRRLRAERFSGRGRLCAPHPQRRVEAGVRSDVLRLSDGSRDGARRRIPRARFDLPRIPVRSVRRRRQHGRRPLPTALVQPDRPIRLLFPRRRDSIAPCASG
ncbi:hypothetical protein STANM309S_05182 [Streptomyces tanashiensis]